MLYIYPLKKDKKTFDANKEELGFASKAKSQRKQTINDIPIGRLSEEQKIALAQEEYALKSKSLQTRVLTPFLLLRRGGPHRGQVQYRRQQDQEAAHRDGRQPRQLQKAL